jgi:hypothetical protein
MLCGSALQRTSTGKGKKVREATVRIVIVAQDEGLRAQLNPSVAVMLIRE